MNTQAEIIDWLRDAYAMEKTQITALNKLTCNPRTHLALRQEAAVHSNVTRQHAAAIAHCLKRLGAETASLKTVQPQGMEMMRNAGAAFARDERIKDVLTVFVTEHFEISCHTILRDAAEDLGLQEIVGVCDKILFQEKRMVEWLQFNLPQIIASYLAPQETVAMEEADPERVEDFYAQRLAQWEFAQLAQTTPLFGGAMPRSAFLGMMGRV